MRFRSLGVNSVCFETVSKLLTSFLPLDTQTYCFLRWGLVDKLSPLQAFFLLAVILYKDYSALARLSRPRVPQLRLVEDH